MLGLCNQLLSEVYHVWGNVCSNLQIIIFFTLSLSI